MSRSKTWLKVPDAPMERTPPPSVAAAISGVSGCPVVAASAIAAEATRQSSHISRGFISRKYAARVAFARSNGSVGRSGSWSPAGGRSAGRGESTGVSSGSPVDASSVHASAATSETKMAVPATRCIPESSDVAPAVATTAPRAACRG